MLICRGGGLSRREGSSPLTWRIYAVRAEGMILARRIVDSGLQLRSRQASPPPIHSNTFEQRSNFTDLYRAIGCGIALLASVQWIWF